MFPFIITFRKKHHLVDNLLFLENCSNKLLKSGVDKVQIVDKTTLKIKNEIFAFRFRSSWHLWNGIPNGRVEILNKKDDFKEVSYSYNSGFIVNGSFIAGFFTFVVSKIFLLGLLIFVIFSLQWIMLLIRHYFNF